MFHFERNTLPFAGKRFFIQPFLALLLLVAWPVFSMAGCSSQPPPGAVAVPGIGSDNANSLPSSAPVELNISAAASLVDVLRAIHTLYLQQKKGVVISANFGSSGTLQTQIENGAPVDVFISAAASQMDSLQKENLLINDTRKNLLYNQLVLIVPAENATGIDGFTDLASDRIKKIAIGDPRSVPAGMYARQVFDHFGIATALQPKEVMGNDARQVLTYVASGNVEAGVVYMTDALISEKVKVAAVAPDEINARIVYPVAVIRTSQYLAAATDYINFLFSPAARVAFEKSGFKVARP